MMDFAAAAQTASRMGKIPSVMTEARLLRVCVCVCVCVT